MILAPVATWADLPPKLTPVPNDTPMLRVASPNLTYGLAACNGIGFGLVLSRLPRYSKKFCFAAFPNRSDILYLNTFKPNSNTIGT